MILWRFLYLAALLATAAILFQLRPAPATQARPKAVNLLIGVMMLGFGPAVWMDEVRNPAHLGVTLIPLIGAPYLIYWWNARVTVVGRWFERRNMFGRVTARGYIAWASAIVPPGRWYPQVHVTLANGASLQFDGEWRNARRVYEAMLEVKCASDHWPETPSLFGWTP